MRKPQQQDVALSHVGTWCAIALHRNEARPQPPANPLGPPYALLQGRLHDLAEASFPLSLSMACVLGCMQLLLLGCMAVHCTNL